MGGMRHARLVTWHATPYAADHTMRHVAHAQLVMLLSLILDEHGAKTINIGDLLGPIIGLLEDQNANVRPLALVCPRTAPPHPEHTSAPACPEHPFRMCCATCCAEQMACCSTGAHACVGARGSSASLGAHLPARRPAAEGVAAAP